MIGPSLSPRISIVSKNSAISASQSTSTLSCVIVCGTFTEKTKPPGVRAFQIFNRASGWSSVESRVNFDGVKSFGAEPEVVGGLHASWIEMPFQPEAVNDEGTE